MMKEKNLVRFINHLVEKLWNAFFNTVCRGPIIFQTPLTFFLPQHFDLLGRRLHPMVLEPDNTRYEEITREYLKILDGEKQQGDRASVLEDEAQRDPEGTVHIKGLYPTKKLIKAKSTSLIGPNAGSTNLPATVYQRVFDYDKATQNLLAMFPEWDVNTLMFIKSTFNNFSNSIQGLMTRQEFFTTLAALGDNTPKLAVLNQYYKYSQRSTVGEGINLKGLYAYMYNSKSSIEKPNTSHNRSKYHLRKKVSDLAELSVFITDMTPDDTIHYGYC